jgi:hypothetical protein
LCAACALSLHHAAPMVTVCPASGERASTNLITLLGTAAQRKLQQLSHDTPNSEEKKRLIKRGRGKGMKGRKEEDEKVNGRDRRGGKMKIKLRNGKKYVGKMEGRSEGK